VDPIAAAVAGLDPLIAEKSVAAATVLTLLAVVTLILKAILEQRTAAASHVRAQARNDTSHTQAKSDGGVT